MAKTIMIQGTMSNAGKSLICTGLCRIFRQDGYKVAPFKSQNMALNSFITEEGLEMGRAQVVQAEAAGIAPQVQMNPILLKPTNDMGSQVIVNGEVQKNMSAREYFAYKKQLIPDIRKAFRQLDEMYDIIVIEGAGSPAEINLKEDDIVNMGMAKMAKAPVLLVGDIDRGGVFAQLLGTLMLLDEDEKEMVKGLLINKFRGDKTILDPGIDMLTERGGIPVVGVAPYLDVEIEDEDSLTERFHGQKECACIDIAVIRTPRISNFTDFMLLENLNGVSLRYVDRPSKLGSPDMIILPGTKNTMEDLRWMRQNGLEARVVRAASHGTVIWGICGGYQMMGEEVIDEEGAESGECRRIETMGLLPLRTVFEKEKIRTRSEGSLAELDGVFAPLSGKCIFGYEIHMGRTEIACPEGPAGTARLVPDRKEPEICRPMCYLFKGDTKQVQPDGWNRGNCYGAYVHGIFDAPGVADTLVNALAEKKGIKLETNLKEEYDAYRNRQYDKLAGELRKALNMELIYKVLGLEGRKE